MALLDVRLTCPSCGAVTAETMSLDCCVPFYECPACQVMLRPKAGDQQQQALVQSAMAAVRQWEYTPARLNNMTTPVVMTVTVLFTRS